MTEVGSFNHGFQGQENPKRLVLVTNKNLTSIGGHEVSMRTMLQLPADWTMISPYPPSNPNVRFIRSRGDIVVPGSHAFVKGSSAHIVTPVGARAINKALQEIDPEAIIIDDYHRPYGMSLYPRLAPELQDRTFAVWRGILTTPSDQIQDSKTRSVLKTIYNGLSTRFANRVRANLAVSDAVAESLVQIGVREDKIKVIPEIIGNDFNPNARIQDRESTYADTLRSKFLQEDELGILYVGRIGPEKGADWIVKLYEQLRNEGARIVGHNGKFKKVKITLVGPISAARRSYFYDLTQQFNKITDETSGNYAADSVSYEYVGQKNSQELYELYNAYDISINPSPSEGFGRTTVEPMRGGMTVFGRAQTPATRAILTEAPYPIGKLIDSPEDATEQVLFMLHNPRILEELQTNAMRWGNTHYSMEEAGRRLWQALEID